MESGQTADLLMSFAWSARRHLKKACAQAWAFYFRIGKSEILLMDQSFKVFFPSHHPKSP
jgi:hypothetical protein